METGKCEKCNQEKLLIHHHVKYPIDGNPEVIMRMLVESIRHVNICTQEALAEALKEAEGL
jgi:hypothetical protein